MSVSIQKSNYGRLPDGTAVVLYTLTNTGGLTVSVSTYGAIITSVTAPDRDGQTGEITLARDTLKEYLSGHPYYGALVGRVCNRISGGGFSVDGTFHAVTNNAGTLHLHGGARGFDKYVYDAVEEIGPESGTVHFTRRSPHGEEGYPGNVTVRYSVTIDDRMRLRVAYSAESDRPTVVNLTNHCYWNLSREPTILNHELRIPATRVLEMAGSLPTGQIVPVAGTAFDFTAWKRVGANIGELDRSDAGGYDHSYAIDGWQPGEPVLRTAAEVRAADTGRTMVVRTSYPAVHLYSGNNLPGETGRDGSALSGREALCLECQYFPDTPNRPEFPSIMLRPGQRYDHVTEHTFGIY